MRLTRLYLAAASRKKFSSGTSAMFHSSIRRLIFKILRATHRSHLELMEVSEFRQRFDNRSRMVSTAGPTTPLCGASASNVSSKARASRASPTACRTLRKDLRRVCAWTRNGPGANPINPPPLFHRAARLMDAKVDGLGLVQQLALRRSKGLQQVRFPRYPDHRFDSDADIANIAVIAAN